MIGSLSWKALSSKPFNDSKDSLAADLALLACIALGKKGRPACTT